MQTKNILALLLAIGIFDNCIANDAFKKNTNELTKIITDFASSSISRTKIYLTLKALDNKIRPNLLEIIDTLHDSDETAAELVGNIEIDIQTSIDETLKAIKKANDELYPDPASKKREDITNINERSLLIIGQCKSVKTGISKIQSSHATVQAIKKVVIQIIDTILIPSLQYYSDDLTKILKLMNPSEGDKNNIALAIMLNRIKEFNKKTESQRNKGILSPDFAALKKLNSDVNDAVSAIAGTSEVVKTVNVYTANELIPYLEKVYKQVDQLNSDLEKYKQKKTSLTTKIKNLFKAEDEKIQTTSKEEKNEIKTKLSEKASSLTRTITDLERVGKKFLTEQDTLKNKLNKMSGNTVVAYGLEQELLTTCYNLTTNAIADVYNVQQKIQNM